MTSLHWHEIIVAQKIKYGHQIQLTYLKDRDSVLSVGDLLEDKRTMFNIIFNDVPSVYDGNFENEHMLIRFELNLNKQEIHRAIYTTLDLLGDIGGLFGTLKILLFVVMLIS